MIYMFRLKQDAVEEVISTMKSAFMRHVKTRVCRADVTIDDINKMAMMK